MKIGILEGDDIGHEIVPAAVEVAKSAARKHGLEIEWRPLPIGRRALDTHGSTLPKETLDALPTLDGWILGPIGHRAYPKVAQAINPHPILRKQFDLFANVRPTRSYPGIGCLFGPSCLDWISRNSTTASADFCLARTDSHRSVPTFQASLTRWSKRRLASRLADLPG